MRWPRSFSEANRRRHELIAKDMQGGLTKDEQREWVLADTFVGEWIRYKHPPNYAMIEELEAMVARLRQGREAVPRRREDRT